MMSLQCTYPNVFCSGLAEAKPLYRILVQPPGGVVTRSRVISALPELAGSACADAGDQHPVAGAEPAHAVADLPHDPDSFVT
jgi:hypothetical protein